MRRFNTFAKAIQRVRAPSLTLLCSRLLFLGVWLGGWGFFMHPSLAQLGPGIGLELSPISINEQRRIYKELYIEPESAILSRQAPAESATPQADTVATPAPTTAQLLETLEAAELQAQQATAADNLPKDTPGSVPSAAPDHATGGSAGPADVALEESSALDADTSSTGTADGLKASPTTLAQTAEEDLALPPSGFDVPAVPPSAPGASADASKKAPAPALPKPKRGHRFRLGLLGGASAYNTLVNSGYWNVAPRPRIGLSLGALVEVPVKYPFEIDLGYMYLRHTTQDPAITQGLWVQMVHQQNVMLSMRLRLFKDFAFHPYVGGTLAVVHRLSRLCNATFVMGATSCTPVSAQFFAVPVQHSPWALDAGLVLGADLQLSDAFALGVDARYFINITHGQNLSNIASGTNFNQYYLFFSNLEQTHYYTLNLALKYGF